MLYGTSAINSVLADKSTWVASVTNFTVFDVGEPTRLQWHAPKNLEAHCKLISQQVNYLTSIVEIII